MGQRLNIEIWDDNKCLANAYYHWSAYTSSACNLVSEILNAMEEIHGEATVHYAIKLLEVTGAGLEDNKEREFAAKHCLVNDFKECTGRNDGLISVTDDGIEGTRYWEEYRVTIYLNQRRVNFGNVNVYRHQWEWNDYIEEYGVDTAKDMENLPRLNYDLTNISFDEFHAFKEVITCGEWYFYSPIMRAAIAVIE